MEFNLEIINLGMNLAIGLAIPTIIFAVIANVFSN